MDEKPPSLYQEGLRLFYSFVEQTHNPLIRGSRIDKHLLAQRYDYFLEEYDELEAEYTELVKSNNPSELEKTRLRLIGEALDVIFTTLGLLHGLGVGPITDQLFEELVKANLVKASMRKVNPDTGKIMKPKDFEPPNYARIVGHHFASLNNALSPEEVIRLLAIARATDANKTLNFDPMLDARITSSWLAKDYAPRAGERHRTVVITPQGRQELRRRGLLP